MCPVKREHHSSHRLSLLFGWHCLDEVHDLVQALRCDKEVGFWEWVLHRSLLLFSVVIVRSSTLLVNQRLDD